MKEGLIFFRASKLNTFEPLPKTLGLQFSVVASGNDLYMKIKSGTNQYKTTKKKIVYGASKYSNFETFEK